jgi:hypothetical protein
MEPEETTITSVPARLDPRDIGGQRGQPVGAQRIAARLHQQRGADLDHQPPRIRQPGGLVSASRPPWLRLFQRVARGLARPASIRARRTRRTSTSPVRATPDMVMTGPPDAASSAARRSATSSSVKRVDLVQHRHPRLVGQPAAIGVELSDDRLVIGDHILRRAVDQVQQHRAALHMAEEHVAEPPALMGALDQAGNVGHDEFRAIDAHDAEIGVQRGEGIIRDLRPRVGGGGEKGRLARVGQAQQPTSAISFSRSQIVRSIPGWPGLARAAPGWWRS